MGTKPGYKITIEPRTNVNAEKDAIITIIQAVVHAFDVNVAFTDTTISGDVVKTSFILDYVEFQDHAYGQAIMSLIFSSLALKYPLIPTLEPVLI
jgi:hypothetical protein